MTQNKDAEIRSEIQGLLLPLMVTPAERETWLAEAFYYRDLRIYHQIDQSGTPFMFVTRCIRILWGLGCIGEGDHALAVLLNTIKDGGGYGEEKSRKIDDIASFLNNKCKETVEPSPPLISPEVASTQTLDARYEGRRPSVFLSYGREDEGTARRLYNDLKAHGIEVWFDKVSLAAGQLWKPAINDAIRNSNYVLALLSSSTLSRRGYFQKELKAALDVLEEHPESGIFLIPVRLDDCRPLDDRLNQLQWVDLFPTYEEGLKRILQIVKPEAAGPVEESTSKRHKAQGAAESEFDILDTKSIIDASLSEVEELLGASKGEIVSRSIGSAEELPDGGETRTYRVGRYEINVNFDKSGIARGLQVAAGLSDEGYSLEQWPVILSRVGVTAITQPNRIAPAAHIWDNYLGYHITLSADKPDGVVWGVRIYKVPTTSQDALIEHTPHRPTVSTMNQGKGETHDDPRAWILRRLYEEWFTTGNDVRLVAAAQEQGWEEDVVKSLLKHMEEEGLIKRGALSRDSGHILDTEGVLAAERERLAPHHMRRESKRARLAILAPMRKARTTSYSGGISIPDLLHRTNMEDGFFTRQFWILQALRVVEQVSGNQLWRITRGGMSIHDELLLEEAIIQEFTDIEQMAPHPRGRALQRLFAKIATRDGWEQEENVRRSNEDLDVVIYKDGKYYFVECKWEKGHTGTEVVDKLSGKLSKRRGVDGIIVSMSGFTSEAPKTVAELANNHTILLFGPQDVQALVNGDGTFDQLLSRKLHQLITRRMAVYE